MQVTKDWIKIRYCELCFREPKDNEKFTYIEISDNDYRPRVTLVACDKCLKALKVLMFGEVEQ